MEIMAVPNPRTYYIINPKNMEAVKKVEEDDLIKIIKSDAYREFVAKLKLHRRKMSSADFGGEFWDYAVLEESIDSTLKELEEKLNG